MMNKKIKISHKAHYILQNFIEKDIDRDLESFDVINDKMEFM